MQDIGFVGLGVMGAPMAANLLQKGFRVTAEDVRSDAVDLLVAEGATAAGGLEGLAYRINKPLAAGYFHVDDRQPPQIGLLEDGLELIDVRLRVVEFRTAHHERSATEKPCMEIRHGERNTIRDQQQIDIIEERRVRRHER